MYRAQMFSVLNITLLQPEEDLAARLDGDARELSAYLSAAQEALRVHYADTEAEGDRALFVAVGPRFKHQFWLAGTSFLPGEKAAVEALTVATDPPAVQSGPVALALIYTISKTPGTRQELMVPEQWRAVVESAGYPLGIDDVILALWGTSEDQPNG
jgi:hypothetical protein